MDIVSETERMRVIYSPGTPLPGATHVVNNSHAQAYFASNGTLLIPGTNSRADWSAFNLNLGTVMGSQIEWDEEGKAIGNAKWYRGFAHYARLVFDGLNAQGLKPSAIIGHSLGGAAAQILGVHYGVPTLTLGSPMPRKQRFLQRELANEHKVLNLIIDQDRVSNVPPAIFGYRMVGKVKRLKFVNAAPSDPHDIDEYARITASAVAGGLLNRNWT